MYLGLDLGTSSLKALVIDDTQATVAVATAELEVSRPYDGWSEQDPLSWIDACRTVLGKLREDHADALGAVTGIGLSGHMHGATVLGADDRPLRPCMLWNDTRSHAEAARLDADPAFRRIAGNIVFPGFTAPKVDWVRMNEPDTFDKADKILLPKDFLRLWLTGNHVSDMSDAAGTAWLDVEKRDWSDTLLSKCALGRDQMPDLVEGTGVSGSLRPDVAAEFGLPRTCIVAGGAGDNAASAIGVGAVGEGDAFVSLGTSGVLFAANDAYRPNPESAVHAFCHALPDTWHQMGVILSATDCLNWFAGITGTKPADLTRNLDTLQAPGSVTFLPYLSGERTPHNDAVHRGSFTGLGHSHTRDDLTRAILEGVTFALRDNLDALAQAGTSLSRVLAVGGGSRSAYWLSAIATALDVEVDLPVGGDFGAALGAARLGMIAATGADPATVAIRPEIANTIAPTPALSTAFDDAYGRYRAAYPAIKSIS